MIRGADISSDGLYRYKLWRVWDNTLPQLVWIMLNPSTADAERDDATIRICMGRAQRMGKGGIRVVNLFAYRATSPIDMKRARDPVGPENNRAIADSITAEAMAMAAWGAYGSHMDRAIAVRALCAQHGVRLYHLGLTQAGAPKHPLRIGYSVAPQFWALDAARADGVTELNNGRKEPLEPGG